MTESDPNAWQDAAVTLDRALHGLLTSRNLTEYAEAIIEVSNARHDLRSWLSGFDPETGTLPWEREDLDD